MEIMNEKITDQERERIQNFWGRISPDEIEPEKLSHRRDLVIIVQTKYGLLREEAEDQIRSFIAYVDRSCSTKKK